MAKKTEELPTTGDVPEEQATPGTRRRVLRPSPAVLWAVAALLVVAAVALALTGGRTWWDQRQLRQAQAEALAAGRQLAVNFVDVDYTDVDAGIDRVRAGATGDFLKDYTGALEQLKAAVVANKTVSSAQTANAAVVSGDRDSAIVIVGVVAPTKNTAVPDGTNKTYRMRLGLELTGGQWKVASLDFVG